MTFERKRFDALNYLETWGVDILWKLRLVLLSVCFLYVVLHSRTLHTWKVVSGHPLTKVGCVGLFLYDLLASCLLSGLIQTTFQCRQGVVDHPCWPVTQGLNNESCTSSTSEIITCSVSIRVEGAVIALYYKNLREVMLLLMGNSSHKGWTILTGWTYANFTKQKFRERWQCALLKS